MVIATIRTLLLTYRLMRDPRVNLFPKLLVAAAIAYLVSPLDFLADFMIPGVGYAEDLVVVWLAIRALIALSPPWVVKEHKREIAAGHFFISPEPRSEEPTR